MTALGDIPPGSAIESGRAVVAIEAAALQALTGRIGSAFEEAVALLLRCGGRVIVTGVGKSGLIARKIVATLNSTGTPSIFLHPSDAVHGDLGMVRGEDVVIMISKSGNTEEIKQITPVMKRIGVRSILIGGNADSQLAQQADIVLDGSVAEEACPYDLAPTASTTVALAIGDALAITLLKLRGFTTEDFALYHPGGILGRRLVLSIEQIMATGDAVPCVPLDTPLKDAIIEMTTKRLGATCVVDAGGVLAGVITDGDLRRLLERDTDMKMLLAVDVMTANPKTIPPETLASTALEIMEQYKITQLIVIDAGRRPAGIVHLHDLIQLGLR
jgi:arabinose-5-phosphate isomerase